MKLNDIRDHDGAVKERTRVGRGIGSGKGKQGGRGGKGQTARSGYRNKGFEGGQMPLHRRLPKRGFNKPNALEYNEVNLGRIQQAIEAGKLDQGAPITIDSLVAAGVCSKPRDGVRILGVGELTAKLAFEIAGASKSAVEAIERAGGSGKILGAVAEAYRPSHISQTKRRPASFREAAARVTGSRAQIEDSDDGLSSRTACCKHQFRRDRQGGRA